MAAPLSPNLNVMIAAAEKASRHLLRDFGEVENLQVSRKGPGDFVSAADRKSEEIIYKELQKARPSFGFLMEEGGEVKGEDGEHRWIIDPLDGTLNFLHSIPHWCISIALEKGSEIIAAVVYNPINDELFHAEKGRGAFSRNKRMRVSGRDKLKDCIITTNQPLPDSKNHEKFMKQFYKLNTLTSGTRCMGAAALELAYVAAGKFDGFFEAEKDLKPWDKAAGTLLVKEAGGFNADLDRQDIVYGNKLFSGNLNIKSDLEKLLKSA